MQLKKDSNWLQNPKFSLNCKKLKTLHYKGIRNLFEIYLSIVDQALIFDNSEGRHDLIAELSTNEELNILNETKFNELKKHL